MNLKGISMQILINPDYSFLREKFYHSFSHFKCIYGNIESFFSGVKDAQIKYILPEQTFFQMDKDFLEQIDYIVLFDDEIRNALEDEFISHWEMAGKLYLGDFSQYQIKNCKKMFVEKLGDFTPDLIISFENADKVLEQTFPNAMQITYANGIFKRGCGPVTFSFDPCGNYKFSFLNKFKNELKNFKISPVANDEIEKFKLKFRNLVLKNNDEKKLIEKYRKKFDYLVLLPLQFNEHCAVDCEIGFKTQYDIVNYVLSNIPENIGVIVTEHDHNRFLENGVIEKGGFLKWFKNKYKNLIYLEEKENIAYKSSSLALMPLVDGIINISSTVNIFALLFDKKIISIGKTANDWCKDLQGLENIEDVLVQPKVNKNNLVYWLLTRYFVLVYHLQNGGYFKNFLEKQMNKYQNKEIDFNFYDEYIDIKILLEHILFVANEYYIRKSKWKSFWYDLKIKINNQLNQLRKLYDALRQILRFLIHFFRFFYANIR